MKKKLVLLFSAVALASTVVAFLPNIRNSSNRVYASIEPPVLEINGKNMSYQEKNYLMFASTVEKTGDNEVKLLEWNEPQTEYVIGTENYSTCEYSSTTVNGTDYRVYYSDGISPKNFVDDLYFRLYVSIEGQDYYSDVVKYSALMYFHDRLNTEGISMAQRAVYESSLTYAASLQILLDYKTDTLATDNYYSISVINGTLDDGTTTGIYKDGTEITLVSNSRSKKAIVDHDGEYDASVLPYEMIDENSLYFGSYPQSEVIEDNVINELNSAAGLLPSSENLGNWKDYGYYFGGEIESYMYYIDIDVDEDGKNDYRGVYFTKYRPQNSISTDLLPSWQTKGGYDPNNVYWFAYEQIKWNILDTKSGKALILADLLLDSQDFNKFTDEKKVIDGKTIYPNNYKHSHIRNWLNDSFYSTAFDELEKDIIEMTYLDSNITSTYYQTVEDMEDKIFLLSYNEARISNYFESDSNRVANGTDYAKCQGLYGNGSESYWLLRTANGNDMRGITVMLVYPNGTISNMGIGETCVGVRPACWITL